MVRIRFDFKGKISVCLLGKTAFNKMTTEAPILEYKIRESVARKGASFFSKRN